MFSLKPYYLLPNSYVFSFTHFIDIYLKWVLITLFLLLIFYPGYLYFYAQHKFIQLTEEQQYLKTETAQKEKLYQSIRQYQQGLQIKDSQISHINQQLQQLFTRYQVKIEHMQWHLEGGKSIHLGVTQNVPTIFKLITELTQLNEIKFKEMTLVKLNKQQLLQFNAIILIEGE